jgi:hypothetical protein
VSFKVGDRVVLVPSSLDRFKDLYDEDELHQTYTISTFFEAHREIWYRISHLRNAPESMLVPEEIYNSPLYRALRES